MIKSNAIKTILKHLLPIILYSVITFIILLPKIINIKLGYGMSDIDTDGTIWYYWSRIFVEQNNLFFNLNTPISYPFGYNVSYIPFFSILYELIIFVIKLLGNNIENIVYISNISSIITYPLTAYFFYLFSNKIIGNKFASFFVGLFSAFSFYFILMSRGSLSLNNLYLIPLFLLSLIIFLDKKNLISIITSSLFFAILFMNNAYWAFFTAIFSFIIIFLHTYFNNNLNKKNILQIIFYYFTLIGITISLNLGFFIQNSYNFNQNSKEITVRIINPQNELMNIKAYFTPPNNSFLYDEMMTNYGDTFLRYGLLALGLSGLFLLRKKEYYKTYLIFFICFLISILLSSKIPGFTIINDLYFKFFGTFRAVSRLNIFATFFLSIISGFVIKYLYDKYFTNRKLHIKIAFIIFITSISSLILLESLNKDNTFNKITKIKGLKQTYEPIKNNNNIKIIAQYPMDLSNGKNGFPPNFQLIGQIIHNKTLVAGADPFNEDSLNYYQTIKDIENPDTIDNLAKYNIDTIIINGRLFEEGDSIVNKLKKDSRLVYVGKYKGESDGDSLYTSANELSRDIDVFQIKSVIEKNKK